MSENRKDSSDSMLIVGGALLLFIFVVYYFYGNQIKYAYLTLKLWQLSLMNLIYATDSSIALQAELINTSPSDWSLGQINAIGKYISFKVNIIYLAILLSISYSLYKHNPLQRLRRTHNLLSLKKSESALWPYITPVLDIDFTKESLSEGPHSMSMRPYDFCVKHNLLKNNLDTSSLDEERARRLFIHQLGPLFQGFDKIRRHERALLAIFAAFGNGDAKGASKAINQIAINTKGLPINKMPDLSPADELMHHLEHPNIKWIATKHAYLYTLYPAILNYARENGVLPSSYFVWLKTRDRKLFYIINVVGRQVSFVEVAAVFAHYKAEQVLDDKLELPYVESAVLGLTEALSHVDINKATLDRKAREASFKNQTKK